MAPYVGPNLATLVRQLRGGSREPIYLGVGGPRARLEWRDNGFVLIALSGGAGLGVAPGVMQPIVDAGLLVRTTTWQQLVAWLCQHWPRDYGIALSETERLRVKFASGEVVVDNLEAVAEAVRAARAAGGEVDFEVVC